jgi:DNA-directed RNA polymerase subunit RPC12/RpoP
MGLKTSCDRCGKVVLGVFSALKKVNNQFLCSQCASFTLSTAMATPIPNRDEVECPYCAEKILAKASYCKHCGKQVRHTSTDPVENSVATASVVDRYTSSTNRSAQNTTISGALKSDKDVSLLLGLGILILPYIFAWFLLKSGYSNQARLIGFGWLAFLLIAVISSDQPAEENYSAPDTTPSINTDINSNANSPATNYAEIPRSMADKGKYFLVEKQVKGNIVRAVHQRVGVDSIGYTITETNCRTLQMRVIGYSEESIDAIKLKPGKWFDLFPGSSKSDLANFVCQGVR